jgi:GNAT superfamily N-acetyltransferase
MTDPGEIARFHDRCGDLMRALLDELADHPDHPRPFPEIEDAMGWPRRRIASVLGGVSHLRHTEFAGRRPYRFHDERAAASGRWEIWMDAALARAVRAAREPVFDNPRALSERAASVLGGGSRHDPFLGQVFVDPGAGADAILERVADRPAFVWAADDPAPAMRARMEDAGFALVAFTAMEAPVDTSTDADAGEAAPADRDPPPVRTADDLAAWHAVYCEVLGADPRSLDDWRRVHAALGPDGDASLILWLATVANGAPAATAALFLDGPTAGLYCFATREPFRRRGLATQLIGVCRRHARRHGAERCVLQASAAGAPVYAAAGFAEVGRVPIFVRR